MFSRRMLAAVLLGVIPWIAHGAPAITSINVSPLPLSPGSTFTVQVQATDVTSGLAYVDFRPAAPSLLRLTLTLNGGSWTASGTVPNMVLPSATTASVQVTMLKGALRATQTIKVPLDDPRPAIAITSPPNLATINSNVVTVVGTAKALNPVIQVNGVTATVASGAFSASVPVNEGNSVITAVGTDGLGKVTTAAIQVTVDTAPPRLTIDAPADGAILGDVDVTVTGTINDTVIGTINGDQATLTINGIPATIVNRTYVVMNVPLNPGLNTITAIGTDRVGNRGTNSIQVTFKTDIAARVQLVSGDAQSAQIGELLPEPLVVRAVDGAGNPATDKKIIFKVTQNDGVVIDGGNTARSLILMSGPDGLAQVQFRLGTRAGAGNNQVSASVVGFEGEAMFCASATPAPAGLIVPDAGNNQVGVPGKALPSPFVAIVVDAGKNRLRNIPVTFTVKEGGGKLGAGLTSMTLNTDGDGRATAVLTLGPDAGNDNNLVEANFTGNTAFPAIFVASARVPGDPAETSISGVVLDNSDVPVPGATLRLVGYPNAVQSDANGFFQIKPAPVGAVRLICDGATVTRPGTWVWLQFNMVTIAGQDNDIGRPIRLLPIDPGSGMLVSETLGGTLTLAKAPGYSLTIVPNSVTFPDGGKSGVVSVTVVHPDKMPDPPSFGQQPRFLISIQPANAIFNPPAAMCLPNLDGLPPGQKTDMYSYDHDLERFVSIGTGTVSEDGMTLCTDPGSGVIKAGWHCGGNPATTGSAGTCPQCYKCENEKCVPDNGAACDDKDPCTVNDKCQNGVCKGDKIEITSVEAKANGKDHEYVCIGEAVSFSATVQQKNCNGLEYEWDFDDGLIFGSTSTEQNPSFTYSDAGNYSPSVEVKCTDCPNATGNDSVTVTVVEVESLEPSEGEEIDDGDGNDDTKTYVVCKEMSGTITVTATPNPGVAESDLPSGWTLTGGTGSGKLQRTIDKTAAGTKVIQAVCGSSEKTVTIHVVEVKVVLASAQSCDGTRVNVDIMVTPTVVASEINDVDFEATDPSGGTSFDNPAGSGIDFSQRGTITQWQIDNVRWYSTQADHCNNTSDYVIRATVQFGGFLIFGGLECVSEDVTFTADGSIPTCFDGSAGPVNFFSGTEAYSTIQDPTTMMYETRVAAGTFRRDVQATFSFVVAGGTSSQFYDMVHDEEEYHAEQQMEDASHVRWGTAFRAENVLSAVQAAEPYVAATAAQSAILARQAFVAAVAAEISRSNTYLNLQSVICDDETEAKNAVGSSHRVRLKCTYTFCP